MSGTNNEVIKEIECDRCDGRGEVPWEFPLWEQCPKCKGKKVITITKEEIDKEIAAYRQDIIDIDDEIQRLLEIFNEDNIE